MNKRSDKNLLFSDNSQSLLWCRKAACEDFHPESCTLSVSPCVSQTPGQARKTHSLIQTNESWRWNPSGFWSSWCYLISRFGILLLVFCTLYSCSTLVFRMSFCKNFSLSLTYTDEQALFAKRITDQPLYTGIIHTKTIITKMKTRLLELLCYVVDWQYEWLFLLSVIFVQTTQRILFRKTDVILATTIQQSHCFLFLWKSVPFKRKSFCHLEAFLYKKKQQRTGNWLSRRTWPNRAMQLCR